MTGLNLCPYKSPCTPDCPKRCPDPNCHSTCKDFLEFRAKVDAETKKKYIKANLSDYQTKQILKQVEHKVPHTWKPYRNTMN